jgi:hypothetical protein
MACHKDGCTYDEFVSGDPDGTTTVKCSGCGSKFTFNVYETDGTYEAPDGEAWELGDAA